MSSADSLADATPRISVIVPHLNTPDLLTICLTSVAAQRLDQGSFEIIVVDNGSQVPLDAVRSAFAQVQFTSEPQPGPGLARNRGATAARAPVLAFIDADCRAAPGWLQAALDAVEPAPDRAVVGGDIRIDAADPNRMTGMEAFETVFGFRQRWYIAKRHFSVTANLAIGAAVLQAVGPFAGIDTAEDLDWGRRAHAAGYPVRFVEAMRVYHPARPDFDSMARKWRRLIQHEDAADRLHRKSRLRWYARAGAMLASIPLDGLRLLLSPQLHGALNRARGLGALARIRAFRAAEMVRVAKAPAGGGAMAWNRGT